MKRKDITALHQKTVAELIKDLQVKRGQLSKLRLESLTKREKNTRLGRNLRDDIARIQTVIATKGEKKA
jgi:ribosomal protein L29